MIEADERTFAEQVVGSECPTFVEFYGVNCGFCRVLEPILREMEGQWPGVRFVKVNIDQNPSFRDAYNLRGVPYMFMFVNGQAVDHLVGAEPRAKIEAMIERNAPRGREHVAGLQGNDAGQTQALGGDQQYPGLPPGGLKIRPRGGSW